MNKLCLFRGAATALITPFCGGAIDTDAYCALLRAQCNADIAALVVCGTTGEASALSQKEQTLLISLAKEHTKGRIPVIAGCGAAVTDKAIQLAKNACAAGADGLLCVTPYYNKCSEEGLYRHFSEIADCTEKPLILYEVPSRTGLRVTTAVYARLATHENIVGIKDASGDINHTSDIRAAVGDALVLYSGDDALTVPMLSLGAQGVISVLSNLLPARMQALCDLWFSHDTTAAAEEQLALLPLMRALFSEVNPLPIKAALAACGQCKEEYRLPLCPMADEKKAVLLQIMQSYDLSCAK